MVGLKFNPAPPPSHAETAKNTAPLQTFYTFTALYLYLKEKGYLKSFLISFALNVQTNQNSKSMPATKMVDVDIASIVFIWAV